MSAGFPVSHRDNMQIGYPQSPSLEGVYILDTKGKVLRILAQEPQQAYQDAALSPGGNVLALVNLDFDGPLGFSTARSTTISSFDITANTFLPSTRLIGDYRKLHWLDSAHYLATMGDSWSNRFDTASFVPIGPPSPARIVLALRGFESAPPVPARCFTLPISAELLVGAGLANCRAAPDTDRTLVRYDLRAKDAAWSPFATDITKNRWINQIVCSPGRRSLAVMMSDKQGAHQELAVLDARTGLLKASVILPAVKYSASAGFSTDGKAMVMMVDGFGYRWGMDQRPLIPVAKRQLTEVSLDLSPAASDGAHLIVAAPGAPMIMHTDIGSGKLLEPLYLANVIAAGFIPKQQLFWAVSAYSGLRIWDSRTWQPLLTNYQFKNYGFLTVTPEGRYDTNLGPDSAAFRWLVHDAPLQSLHAQTFMRDYFEPQLAKRLLDCTKTGSCSAQFPALPSLSSINRTLPRVRFLSVVPGTNPGTAHVTVEARETLNKNAPNGKTRSGLFNLRLFLNNRLVGTFPPIQPEAPISAAEWNSSYQVAAPVSAAGAANPAQPPFAPVTAQFEVTLPTSGAALQTFSAYAFNDDRVKSDTATLQYPRPQVAARARRAFLIAIGINAYDEEHFQLHFAAPDAHLMARRLSAIPGYDMRQVLLTGEPGADGVVRRVTRRVVELALGLLAHRTPEQRAAAQKELTGLGFNPDALDEATPDDIVIITYSGHGYTSPAGQFHLAPSEAHWDPVAQLPDTRSLIGSTDLSAWVMPINAGEMALVIDACNSAAAVASAGFKPAPMGDRGLGQLAFDKGIRILVASQTAEVALEDPVLGQGLLTYALAREGLTERGGAADLDGDRRITLDEWLRFGVQRLPGLSAHEQLAGAPIIAAAARGMLTDDDSDGPPKPQEPQLFDFTGRPSDIVLRVIR
jgi:hypothetical protein